LRRAGVRIVGGDPVRVARIHIDAKQVAQQRGPVLTVVIRIPSTATIAHADVELAVRPELELAPVVI
jgi:hypothetical protein